MSRQRLTGWLGAVAAAVLLAAGSAQAAAPPFLVESPEGGRAGSAAGRIDIPEGIAADPNLPGHLYVVDRNNARIDEFTAWGGFVKAWGWGVRNGEAKLETCTEATGCRKGLEGGGKGQFKEAEAIAVDGAGNVYVLEAENRRVQKFAPEGEAEDAKFLLTFGLDVNKTAVEEGRPQAERNLCPAPSHPADECQAGTAGTGTGQFGGGHFSYLSRLTASPATNNVFVGEGERIQVFNPTGSFNEAIAMPAGAKVAALTADLAGNLYAAIGGQGGVRKLKPSGPLAEFLAPEFKPELEAERPRSLALDGAGDLYVVVGKNGEEPERVQEYDKVGNCLTCGSGGEGGKPGFDRSLESQLEGVAATGACGVQDAYTAHFGAGLSFVKAFGPHPDTHLCPQPVVPPRISFQYALSVEAHGAEVGADINPKFWPDTTFRVEYGTGECRAGGCPLKTAETSLTSQVIGNALATPGVILEGLAPGTTYHYRFIAESGGGGPIYGVDPDGPEGPEEATEEAGLEGTLRTFAEPVAEACPQNEAFRGGASSLLPDCRAYEMVSPLDKEGGDVQVLGSTPTLLPAVLSEAATSGERMSYGSYRPFGDAESAPWTTQYIAARHEDVGWESHAISPPRGKTIFALVEQTNAEFKAFTPDLCSAWLESFAEPPLAPGAPSENVDLYRRTDEECGGPGYEALNTTAPAGPAGGLQFELQGLSADGATAAFRANRPLASGATSGKLQLYGARGAVERFMCILPGGGIFTGSCTAGSGTPLPNGQEAQVTNALSADGSRLYWTASESGSGKIYLRENPFGNLAEECAGEGSPCTLAVSKAAEEEAATTKGSQFWAAARDGSRAIFTTGTSEEGKEPELYEWRLAGKGTQPIAKRVLGVMGTSSDAKRIYFASKEVLVGPNEEGKSPVEGEANLYLYEAAEGLEPGSVRFVTTLGAQDLLQPSPVAENLQYHEARVTPDGQTAVFPSYASLTGYDNTDRSSGKSDTELFVYEAAADEGKGKLLCASCNPSGARPAGREFILLGVNNTGPWTAARIPVPQNVLYASRVLSEDGHRLLFDSYDALVPRDTNGRADVYQWEAAGEGRCTSTSTTYTPANDGCVDLISSGKSPTDAELLDASPSGDDVFFTTLSSLVPQDYGLQDVYDARVNGGLPSPPPAPAPCEGESCRHPAAPPAFATPASRGYEGPEDRGGCPKGSHRARGKCVKNKHRHHKHKHKKRGSHRGRRAGR